MVEVAWLECPDEKALAATAELVSAFLREVIPGEPDTPAAEFLDEMRHVPYHRQVLIAVATDDGWPVGTAELALSDLAGKEDIAEVEHLVVRSACRRSGVGRALLDAVCARAGGRRIRGYVPTAHRGGMGFASSVGATPGLVDRQNRLQVADLDRSLLEGWVRSARERASGYSLVGFDGPCPEEMLERFTRLTHVMNTAPRSPGDEEVHATATEELAHEEALQRRTAWAWTVCARHDATDELVGYTGLLATTARPWLAQQEDTGVEPAHRNLGLGRWLKAANALRLLDERPEVTTVETWNAGVNAAMLAINHAMGFHPVAEWQEWTLERG